jgi:hypothetical protein
VCSNDSTNFPSSTKYNLCPIAGISSICGISPSNVLRIFDGEDIAIISYLITNGEMCNYAFTVEDPLISTFTVQLLTATNLNVEISKEVNSGSYTDAKTITSGSSVTVSCSKGDRFKITAVTSGGDGTMAMYIKPPTTGYGDDGEDKTPQTAGIVFASYFGAPWIIMFVVMGVLY